MRTREATARAEDFDRFFAANFATISRRIYLATGDAERAQDCTQEAFIRLWQRWDQLEAHQLGRVGWVKTVAWRLAVSDWRRTQRLQHLLNRTRVEHAPAPSEDAVAIEAALARIPAPQREAVVMYYFADLPINTIAEVLGVAAGTIKARLHRGRHLLEQLLQPAEARDEHA